MVKKTRGRAFGALLALVMALGLLPATAFADGTATATTGTTIKSTTTQAELDAWAGEGAISISTEDGVTTVTLLKDFNLSTATTPIVFGGYDFAAGKYDDAKMVLDLNGHTITSVTIAIQSSGDLTIRDSWGGGKVLMDTTSKPSAAYSAVVNQYKLTIEGGTFEAKVDASNVTAGVIESSIKDAQTVINSGSFVCTGASAMNFRSGTTTINGGTFEADAYGVIASGTAVVNFPAGSTAAVTAQKFAIVLGEGGDVNIADGQFETDGNLVGALGGATAKDLLEITGGVFAKDPSGFVPDGTLVASLTASGEESFAVGAEDVSALAAAAQSGDTLEVVAGSADFTNVPDGVVVSNTGGGAVTVNGQQVMVDAPVIVCTHTWGEPVWTWTDATSAAATFVCTKNSAHTETVAAAITSEVTKAATCTEKGETTYTAKVTFAGKEYTASKVIADIEMTGHNYVNGACTRCGLVDPNHEKAMAALTNVPQTGDGSGVTLFAGMALMSAAALGALALCRRKSDEA